MATAKKLKSGSWRCLVYDYTDTAGKRHYKSFTSENPSKEGKREAEYLAAQFAIDKKTTKSYADVCTLTLKEAIDDYINSADALLSPTTIDGYKAIQDCAFQDIMDISVNEITTQTLADAVNREAKRASNRQKAYKPISAKTVRNEYGLIVSVLNKYNKSLNTDVKLPKPEPKFKTLLEPQQIFEIVKGTEIELPVLLAMWLSFSISEIRGIRKSTSVKNGYITIDQVIVDVNGVPSVKNRAKVETRTRKHKIPSYVQELIDKTDKNEDYLVTLSGKAIYFRFNKLLKENNLPHMAFHDLRHVNASVMAMLNIPDKYAQERGGWKTDYTMKKVYTHTFSEERKEVDNKIDTFFENTLFKKTAATVIPYNKFLEILNLTDNEEVQHLYSLYTMQHEMQHKT